MTLGSRTMRSHPQPRIHYIQDNHDTPAQQDIHFQKTAIPGKAIHPADQFGSLRYNANY
jgi:hypothetical protein